MEVVLLNVFSDEREISYETTLDGIVRENELRMSYKDDSVDEDIADDNPFHEVYNNDVKWIYEDFAWSFYSIFIIQNISHR